MCVTVNGGLVRVPGEEAYVSLYCSLDYILREVYVLVALCKQSQTIDRKHTNYVDYFLTCVLD